MTRKKGQKIGALVIAGGVAISNLSVIYADDSKSRNIENIVKHNIDNNEIFKNKLTDTTNIDILKGGLKKVYDLTGSPSGIGSISDYLNDGVIISGIYSGWNKTSTLNKDREKINSRLEDAIQNQDVIGCSSLAENGDILIGLAKNHKVIRVMDDTRFIQKNLDLFSEMYKGQYYKGEDGIRAIKELPDGNIVVVTFSSISFLDSKLNKLKEVTFEDLGFNDINKERMHGGSDIVLDKEGIIIPFWDGLLKLDFNLDILWYKKMTVGTLSYQEGENNFLITSKDKVESYNLKGELQGSVKVPTYKRPNVNLAKIDEIPAIQQIDENLAITGVMDFAKSILTISLIDVKNENIVDSFDTKLKEINGFKPSGNHIDNDVLDLKQIKDGTIGIIANNTYLELVNKVDMSKYRNEQPKIKLKDKYKDKLEIEQGKKDTNFLDFVTATDKEDGDISKNIKVDTSKLDINKEGEYTITYSVIDSKGATATLDTKIKVVRVNKKPSIKLKDKYKDKIEIEQGKKDTNFLDFVTATDEEDGDISKDIKVDTSKLDTSKEGEYTITYNVKDSEGATATLDTKIKVVRVNKKPSIKLKDKYKDKIEIEQGKKDTNFLDFVTATDEEDGDISKDIKVDTSKLDTSKEGEYTITYNVKDSEGATATLDTKIKVVRVNKKPSIKLKDKYKDKIEIDQGKKDTNFLDFVTATDEEDGDISKDIKVDTSKLDTSKEGEYTITYSVKDSEGATATLDAKIKVVRVDKKIGEAPSINANDKVIKLGSNFYPFREISANDKEDGNLTGFIKLKYNELDTEKVGDYKVVYTVTDKDNNTTEKSINVKVKDFGEKPVINVFDITLEKGQAFNQMENISATDKEDGDISKNIKVISNNVNVNVPGNYLVEYSVQDSDGNTSKRTRNIIVNEIDGVPIIDAQNLKIAKGSDLDLFENISAKDQNGNDITSSIKIEKMNLNINEKGVYNVIYSANDKDGNIGTKSVTIKVIEAPKIIAEDLTIPVNSKTVEKSEHKEETIESRFLALLAMNNISYAAEKEDNEHSKNGFDPLNYAIAKDSEDGDISEELKVVSSNVNPNKAGTYSVKYAVTNSNNIKSEKDIKVKVVNPNEKQPEGNDDKDNGTVTDTDKENPNTEGNNDDKDKDKDNGTVTDTDKENPNTEGNNDDKDKDKDNGTVTDTDKENPNTEGNNDDKDKDKDNGTVTDTDKENPNTEGDKDDKDKDNGTVTDTDKENPNTEGDKDDKGKDNGTVTDTDKKNPNTEGNNEDKEKNKGLINNADKEKSNTEVNKHQEKTNNNKSNVELNKNADNSNINNPKTGDKGLFVSFGAFGTSAILLIFRNKIFRKKENK